MTKLDRLGNLDNFNFRAVPSFLQSCEKRCRRREVNNKQSLHSDGFAKYL